MPASSDRLLVSSLRPWMPAMKEPTEPKAETQSEQLTCSLTPSSTEPSTWLVIIWLKRWPARPLIESPLEPAPVGVGVGVGSVDGTGVGDGVGVGVGEQGLLKLPVVTTSLATILLHCAAAGRVWASVISHTAAMRAAPRAEFLASDLGIAIARTECHRHRPAD